MKYFYFTLILFFCSFQINCLYFHLYQGIKKCFYDEFYTDLVVMVRYEILDKGFTFTTTNDKRLEVALYRLEDKKVLYKLESGKLSGKFSHTIEKCMYNDLLFYNLFSWSL